MDNINRGRVFVDDVESSQFNLLFYDSAGTYTVSRMALNAAGNLSTINTRTIAHNTISSVLSVNTDKLIIGTTGGALWSSGGDGERLLKSENPELLIAAAISSSFVAFISETGIMGYIPLDFTLLHDGVELVLQDANGPRGVYTRISADRKETRFLLWHGAQTTPMVKTLRDSNADHHKNDDYTYPGFRIFIDSPALNLPLRAATIMDGNVLLLNTAGSLSVLDHLTGEIKFSQSLPGSQDAAFIDRDTVIIARSVIGMTSPFLILNINTGETVHINYPALVGTRVSGSASGRIHASALGQTAGNRHTSIISIDILNPVRPENLFRYEGERSVLSMTESAGSFAYSMGREGSILNYASEKVPLERSMGLPVQIMDGGRWFVILDGEGGLTWHDNQTGELQAVFRLYKENWVLEDHSYPGRKITKGPRINAYSS